MGGFFGGGASVSNMVGATSSVAGTAGLVPAPAEGQENNLLKGSASFGWVYPKSTDLNGASDYATLRPTEIGGFVAGSLVKTKLYIFPIVISGAKTFNRMGFRFGGASGCKVRIGLYNCDTTNFRASTLISESTELTGSNNTNVEFTISPSITLKNTIYWLGFIPELDTTVLATGQYEYIFSSYFGNPYGATFSSTNSRLYVDFTYAALPSDLSSYAIKQETGQNQPLVWLRNA